MAPLWVPLVQELIYSPASDLLVDRNTKHSICFLHFLQKMFFNYVSQRKCPSRYFAMKVAWSWRKGRWGMSRHTLNRRSHSFFSFAEHVWLYLVTTWDLSPNIPGRLAQVNVWETLNVFHRWQKNFTTRSTWYSRSLITSLQDADVATALS